MIKTVSYLVVGALAASAWVVNAEAQGTGNPTGGKFQKNIRDVTRSTRVSKISVSI